MRAIVIYDSKHGNTEKIAEAIASGLREAGVEVECRKLALSSEEDLVGRDLWVLGSGTRWGGAPLGMKTLLRNGLKEDAIRSKRGAFFDTRFADMGKGAAETFSAIFSKSGAEVIATEHFTVLAMRGPLLEGEEEKAKAFGLRLGRSS
jgi:flavodoxin